MQIPHRIPSYEIANRELFAHAVSVPESELQLDEAALLIGTIDKPDIEFRSSCRVLDELGSQVRERFSKSKPPHRAPELIEALLDVVFHEAGFAGNADDYYDPRNSFLDQVLERRLGIPISLSVVLIEVARRGGFTLTGVSFPGNFLIRCEDSVGVCLVDPFEGKLLDPAGLQALYERMTGKHEPVPVELTTPCSKRELLLRMLKNLNAIYEKQDDAEKLERVTARAWAIRRANERFPMTSRSESAVRRLN